LLYRAWACIQVCRFAEADRCLDELASLSRSLRQPRHLYFSRFNEVWRALLRGHLQQAEELASEAASIATQSQGVIYATQLLDIRRQQGRLDEMTGVVEDAMLAFPELPFMRPILAWVYAEAGNLQGAGATYAPEADLERTESISAPLYLLTLSCLATACSYLGDVRRAESLYRRMLAFDGQTIFTFAVAFAPVALHLGNLASVLGRTAVAERHFADARRVADEAAAPYWRASAELGWAAALAADPGHPGRDRSRELLASVLTVAGRHGYGALERDARHRSAALEA
jgi:tetratricopeptide (TPR) repeat protein